MAKQDVVRIRLEPGMKDAWQRSAKERGWTLSTYLRNAVSAFEGTPVETLDRRPSEPETDRVRAARERLRALRERRVAS